MIFLLLADFKIFQQLRKPSVPSKLCSVYDWRLYGCRCYTARSETERLASVLLREVLCYRMQSSWSFLVGLTTVCFLQKDTSASDTTKFPLLSNPNPGHAGSKDLCICATGLHFRWNEWQSQVGGLLWEKKGLKTTFSQLNSGWRGLRFEEGNSRLSQIPQTVGVELPGGKS